MGFPRLVVAVASLTLVGCVSQPPALVGSVPAPAQPEQAQVSEPAAGTDKNHSVQYNFTPFTYFEEKIPKATTRHDWDDLYTKIIINPINLPSGTKYDAAGKPLTDRDYALEMRGLLARFFAGKSYSTALSLKVAFKDNEIAFEANLPVATLSHDSNSGVGERFDTGLWHRMSNQLVRVSASTTIEARVEFNKSESLDTKAVSAALKVAETATSLIAPGSALITKLSERKMSEEARLWDGVLSKLFGVSLAERHSTRPALASIVPEAEFISFGLRVPRNENDMKPTDDLGRWSIALQAGQPSMFSNFQICSPTNSNTCKATRAEAAIAAVKAVAPGRVLAAQLTQDQTIIDWLSQQAWFVDSFVGLEGATPGPVAEKLCSRVVTHVRGLGLTTLDARLAAWALSVEGPFSEAGKTALKNCTPAKEVETCRTGSQCTNL